MPDNKPTPNDTIFSVFGALDNLNNRLKDVEGKVPDYTADMLEVYRNIGVLAKRIEALETKLKEVLMISISLMKDRTLCISKKSKRSKSERIRIWCGSQPGSRQINLDLRELE